MVVVQGHHLQILVSAGKAAGGDNGMGDGILSVQQHQVFVVPAIVGRHEILPLLLRLLGIQPVYEIQQAVRHDLVAQVAGVVDIIEILPLGNHPVRRLKLGGHRLQYVHHGQLIPVADGCQTALQVPVVGEHGKQQNHRRAIGALQNVTHQAFVEHALGLVPGVVHREFNHHQIRLNPAVPGDVPVIPHEPRLRGGASHACLDVADVLAVPLAQTLPGTPGVAVFLQGHRSRPLGDGAAQKGHGDLLPCLCPAEEILNSFVVAGAEEGPGNHFPVFGAFHVHNGVRVLIGNGKSIVDITLDGDRGHVRHGGHFKPEFSQTAVKFAPGQLFQVDHPLRPVGGEGEAVAAAGAAVTLAHQGEHHLHAVLAGDGHADAVHQLPEACHAGEQLQNGRVLDTAGDLGERGQPVAADVNGVPASAVILGGAPHLRVQ